MKITKNDLNNFHKNGYIIKRNFFSKKDIKNIYKSLNYLIDLIVSKYLNKEQLKTYTLDQKYIFLLRNTYIIININLYSYIFIHSDIYIHIYTYIYIYIYKFTYK